MWRKTAMTRCRSMGLAFLLSLSFILEGQFVPVCRGEEPAPRKPNIILIVVDNLGYGDIGVHGCQDIATPHLDSMAREGIRCTNGYTVAPSSSTARAGLMTGRYPQRWGHFTDAQEKQGLPRDHTTLPQVLDYAGYATGQVGKWHLGTGEGQLPAQRGFREFSGFLGVSSLNLSDRLPQDSTRVEEQDYLPDAVGREGLAFIDRHKDRPFFLYLS